jgi:hypothetical protein
LSAGPRRRVLSVLPHPKHLARGPDRSGTSMIRASPLPGTLMLFKADKLEWSSPSCRTKKASCAHTPDRNPVHDRGPRLFLAPSPCLGGQARVGLSVLPHRKHLARARLKPAFSRC